MRAWFVAQIVAIGAVIVIVPYLCEPWWRFVPATAALFFLARQLWPQTYGARLGWRCPPAHAALAVALCALVIAAGAYFVKSVAASHGFRLQVAPWHLLRPLVPFFQAGNEEMVFRALLLELWLERGGKPLSGALGGAILFAVAHALFFPLTQGGPLTLATGASLTALGLGLNLLYLRFRHVAFPLAVHAGWNVNQFGWGRWVRAEGTSVPEFVLFNAFAGDFRVLAAALALVAVTALVLVTPLPALGSRRPG